MRKPYIFALSIVALLVLLSCSPRDFLTRRLAADLIATSNTFRATQSFQMTTGIVSNADYLSTEYLALQHHGWISATQSRCPPDVTPPPAGMSRSHPPEWIHFALSSRPAIPTSNPSAYRSPAANSSQLPVSASWAAQPMSNFPGDGFP